MLDRQETIVMVRLVPGEPTLVPASQAHRAALALKGQKKKERRAS